VVGLSLERALHFNDPEREVGGRGPEAGRSHLRIGVGATGNGLALLVGGESDLSEASGGKRLLIGTVAHADRAENQRLHDLRERLAGSVDHHLLDDGESAPGVAEGLSWSCGDADGFRVGGLDAVKDLLESRDRIRGGVAGESMDICAGSVGEEFTEGNALLRSEVVLRKRPVLEFGLDGSIE
jgi:hypothetical protein